MENNSYNVSNRLDYLEFRQNILILKQPCHKATVFFDLTIDIYLEMKEKSNEFSQKIRVGQKLNLSDYEKLIISIWPNISNYPSACSLIAKSLLDKDLFDSIVE
ncbi:hypothetical protein [Intestinibacter sp.]